MNWKERFDKQFIDYHHEECFAYDEEDEKTSPEKCTCAVQEAKDFISTEIIEKLIEDSVSLIPKGEFFRDYPTGGLEKLDQLKQDIRESLRKAWL